MAKKQDKPSAAQRKAAVLWAAMQSHAKKGLVRAHLDEGAAYEIEIQITGRCKPGGAISEAVAGRVTVGHATSSTSSSDVGLDRLGALLAEKIPVDTWRRLCAELPFYFATNGELPEPKHAARVEEFAALREQLRVRRERTTAAPISFRPTG